MAALRRRWPLALLPLLALVAAAVVLGLKRTPQYTATAEVSVGPIYFLNPAGISSVIQGTQDLAAVYSRAVSADSVRRGTAQRLGRPAIPATDQLSATPIPESPLIKIQAVSPSESRSMSLANAAAAALTDYVNGQVRSSNDAATLSARYERAALRYRQLLDKSDRLKRRMDASPTKANKAAADRAGAAADTALLHRSALLVNYQQAVQATSSKPAVGVFASATSATSDRYKVLEILVFAGLVGGLVAGFALVVAAAPRAPAHSRRE